MKFLDYLETYKSPISRKIIKAIWNLISEHPRQYDFYDIVQIIGRQNIGFASDIRRLLAEMDYRVISDHFADRKFICLKD